MDQRSRTSEHEVDDEAELTVDDVDADESWSGTVWQYTVIAPFSD